MRNTFANEVSSEMVHNQDIWVLVGDMGYGMWDEVRNFFPDRFVNTGACEVSLINIAVGLALSGKVPVVYTATPFLLYRPFEQIRLYIDHEKIPVKLVGSGRDKDYHNEGYSHWSQEAKQVLSLFPNIVQYWPDTTGDVKRMTRTLLTNAKPSFISLKR